jgi:hypothetical protein
LVADSVCAETAFGARAVPAAETVIADEARRKRRRESELDFITTSSGRAA